MKIGLIFVIILLLESKTRVLRMKITLNSFRMTFDGISKDLVY